ncbi:uncharacterized protein J3R85_020635 [Psidium guajava]|nr:uncharacterized protein J3R85_020635 [Psidium guajava]
MISWPISPPTPNTLHHSPSGPLFSFHIPCQESSELMAEEGFSFPGIPDPSACSICSPPLWPVSPPPAPPFRDRSSSEGSDEGVLGDMAGGEAGGLREEEEEEEKMDMLWEDFNEELPRSHRHPDVSSSSCSSASASTSLSWEKAEFGGAKEQAVSRANVALVSARRTPPPGVVVLIKALKKLFLLHHSPNTPGSMKKPCTW